MPVYKKISMVVAGLTLSALVLSGCLINPSSSKRQPADGGLFKSTDFGENWQQKTPAIAQADMRFMTFDPTDSMIAYLSMNGAGVYKTLDGGESWQGTTLSTGTYLALAIDHLNTSVLYAVFGNKIIKTADDMTSWFDTYVETRPDQTLVTVLTDPFNSNILYAAATTSIIKSTDYGNTWRLLPWQEPTINGLYHSANNSNTLYALTNKGIFKSTSGGASWVDVSQGLAPFPGASTIYWFDFDPHTDNIFLGTTDSILKSTNGAIDWQEVPTLFEFKKVPIKAVVHNPSDLNQIIFPYNNILLKTDDGGKTWKSLKSVPTNRLITSLTVNPYDHDTIYAGTTTPPPPKKKSRF